jgi:CRP/FNR family cyclic AMP-dependent transcriptional regulator
MFVIKKGRIAITKSKGDSEIILAELVAGEMLGEMAFFDNRPRSAGAKAAVDCEVIVLPFKALHSQFKTFPEWLKAMVKTVNSHLRNANQRIKNLESTPTDSANMFPPHMITRLTAIISLIGFKSGEKDESTGGLVIPYTTLRNYCIQIFQAPTNKLDRIMDVLASMGYMKVEDLGEGKKKITILNHKVLTEFTDWYNKYLFTEDSKKVTIEERELDVLRALTFYGRKQTPNEKGEVVVNLTEMQNNSMKDLGKLIDVNMPDGLTEKKIIQDKQSIEGGNVTTKFNLAELETILPFWEMVYNLKKIPGR